MPPSFVPTQVTIKAGDTVKWENVGNSVHHATSDPSDAINPANVANPLGARRLIPTSYRRARALLIPSQFLEHTNTYARRTKRPGCPAKWWSVSLGRKTQWRRLRQLVNSRFSPPL
jgi:hypothetical protein